MKNLPAKWRKDADQYMRQVAEAGEKGIPHERTRGCADGLREAAKDLERDLTSSGPPKAVEHFLIEWERELRAKGGDIGSKDIKAYSLAGRVAVVRRALQEQFGLVSIP